MRVQRFIAGGLVATALMLSTAVSAGAANVSWTPGIVDYANPAGTFTATGLTPRAAYTLTIYEHNFLPIVTIPFVAGADGGWTTKDLTPDQTDLPGIFTFEVASADGKLVARSTATLTGTNTYYVQHRLGS